MILRSYRQFVTQTINKTDGSISIVSLDNLFKKALSENNTKVGVDILQQANKACITLDEKHILSLGLKLPPHSPLRRTLVENVRIHEYFNPSLNFLNFLIKSQVARLANSPVFNKIIDDTKTGKSRNISWLNILIEGLAKQGDVSNVENILSIMRDLKIKPNHQTYGALMETYSRGHQGDKVIELWFENPFKTPENCQNQIAILLDSCGFNNDIETLLKMWKNIQDGYYIINSNIFRSYIQALMRHGDYVKAVSTFSSEMCSNSYVAPDEKTLDLIVTSLQRSKALRSSPSYQKFLINEVKTAYLLFKKKSRI